MKTVCLVTGCERAIFLNGLCFEHTKEPLIIKYKLDLKKINKEINIFRKKKMLEFYNLNKEYWDVKKVYLNYIKYAKENKIEVNKVIVRGVKNDNSERKQRVKNNYRKSRRGGVERFRQTRELLF